MTSTATQTFSGLQLAAISLLLVGMNALFAYDVILFAHHEVHGENALLENLQAMFLGLATALFLVPTPANIANQCLNKAFALLCFSFLLRELDLEYLGLPALLVQVGTGTGRTMLLTALWTMVLYGFVHNVQDKPQFLRQLLRSYKFVVMAVVLVLLAISAVMDKELLPISPARLYEELAETNAYFMMLLVGFVRLAPRPQLAAAA
jgi:hypothetical protein